MATGPSAPRAGASYGISYSIPPSVAPITAPGVINTTVTTSKTLRQNVLDASLINVIPNQSGHGTVISVTGAGLWVTGTLSLNFGAQADSDFAIIGVGIGMVPLGQPFSSATIIEKCLVSLEQATPGSGVVLYRNAVIPFTAKITGSVPQIFFPLIDPTIITTEVVSTFNLWGSALAMSLL